MARDNDHLARRLTASAPKSLVGSPRNEDFQFASPEHERIWQQQAYRQSVHPDRWQGQPPVDSQTQSLLDVIPHLSSGQFFRGPDGKHRRVTMDIREDRDVQSIRRNAFNEFAQSGVTWAELGQYPNDKPHPGEETALALMRSKRIVSGDLSAESASNKTRDMGAQSKDKPDLTKVAGDLDLDLSNDAPVSGTKPTDQTKSVLVASNDRAVSGLPKEIKEAQAFLAPSTTTPQQRRAFNENLVGRAANDNYRAAANDNNVSSRASVVVARGESQQREKSVGIPSGTTGEVISTDEGLQAADRLFNWSRKGQTAPAPKEYAVHVASEEGRFTYLEGMKDEWSRLLEKDPEKVFQSMAGEVEKLSNAAQQDFLTGHHRLATTAEIAEMEEAIAQMVFAPAEHWTEVGANPNEKPYIALQSPQTLTGTQLAEALTAASEKIATSQGNEQSGRPGSLSTRAAAETIAKKLAAAIKACGGKVRVELYGHKEPQIQRIQHQVKESRYPDSGVPFEIGGRTFGAFVSHYTPGAGGITMNLREAIQWDGLIENLGRAIIRGDLGIEAAGIGAIRKQAPNESDGEYLKMIDDLIKEMINCKRPFLIKLDINPRKISSKLEQIKDLKDSLEK